MIERGDIIHWVPWGNTNHIAPELHRTMKSTSSLPSGCVVLDFRKQSVFEIGVLTLEMMLYGVHPIHDYGQRIEYGEEDISTPVGYPPAVVAEVKKSIVYNVEQRYTLHEFLDRFMYTVSNVHR